MSHDVTHLQARGPTSEIAQDAKALEALDALDSQMSDDSSMSQLDNSKSSHYTCHVPKLGEGRTSGRKKPEEFELLH